MTSLSGGSRLPVDAKPNAERRAALCAVFDPVTARHLDAIGVGTGWRCWEVGAGDVAAEPAPDRQFDLVHARLLLMQDPGRDEALRRMAGALKPGGWLLLEDFDVSLLPQACPQPRRPIEYRANRVRAAFVQLLTGGGADLEYGRSLPRRLAACGLVDVGADGYLPLAVPGSAALEVASIRRVRAELVASGLSALDLDRHLDAVTAGRLQVATPPLVSAWGRRPSINEMEQATELEQATGMVP